MHSTHQVGWKYWPRCTRHKSAQWPSLAGLILPLILQGNNPFMKQQGFRIAESTHHAKDAGHMLSDNGQSSSKLAEGLQGLLEMCDAGSFLAAPAQTQVRSGLGEWSAAVVCFLCLGQNFDLFGLLIMCCPAAAMVVKLICADAHSAKPMVSSFRLRFHRCLS